MAAEELTGEITPLYTQIFDEQGIHPELRNPDDYFFYTVSLADLDVKGINTHIGETYALPRQIGIKGVEGFFAMQDSGALVSETASIDKAAQLAARSVVHAKALVAGSTEIGRATIVGESAWIRNSIIGAHVTLGPETNILESKVWSWTTIGRDTKIKDRTSVASDVTIGDMVELHGNNSVDSACVIGDSVALDYDAVLGKGVQIGHHVIIGRGTEICAGSMILRNQSIADNEYIPPNRLIYPERFRRARKNPRPLLGLLPW